MVHQQWKQRHDADVARRMEDSLQATWETTWKYIQLEKERRDRLYHDLVSRYGAEYVTLDSAGNARLRTEEELRAYRRDAGIPELQRICGTFSGEFQCVTVWVR